MPGGQRSVLTPPDLSKRRSVSVLMTVIIDFAEVRVADSNPVFRSKENPRLRPGVLVFVVVSSGSVCPSWP